MNPTRQHVTPMVLCTTLLSLLLSACGAGDVPDDKAAAEEETQLAAASTDGTLQATGKPRTKPSTVSNFPITSSTEVAAVAQPYPTRHEALGAGVPLDYDWAQYSRLRAGNTPPPGMGALTGWGQVFWLSGITTPNQAVEIRSLQTFLCSTVDRRWTRVQKGSLEGAAFWPDFSNNDAIPATMTATGTDGALIAFPAGRAFHYWPKGGRAAFDGQPVCGLFVAFQARAVASNGSALPTGTPSQLLIGAGADYWTTTTAPWADNSTNPGIALGQLRKLTPEWRWYGLNTAGSADLDNLVKLGYLDRALP